MPTINLLISLRYFCTLIVNTGFFGNNISLVLIISFCFYKQWPDTEAYQIIGIMLFWHRCILYIVFEVLMQLVCFWQSFQELFSDRA